MKNIIVFGLCFTMALNSCNLMAGESDDILGLYKQEVQTQEADLLSMRSCIKRLKAKMTEQVFKNNCKIFYQKLSEQDTSSMERSTKNLQKEYSKLVDLYERKLVSKERYTEVLQLRIKLANVLDAKADAIDEYIALHNKWAGGQKIYLHLIMV